MATYLSSYFFVSVFCANTCFLRTRARTRFNTTYRFLAHARCRFVNKLFILVIITHMFYFFACVVFLLLIMKSLTNEFSKVIINPSSLNLIFTTFVYCIFFFFFDISLRASSMYIRQEIHLLVGNFNTEASVLDL